MDDSSLIPLVCLAILFFLGIGRASLVVAVILAAGSAEQKRRRATVPAGHGYPQATQPLSVPSAPPVEASLRYRLWELDSLRRGGVISFDEYAFARHSALASTAAGFPRHGMSGRSNSYRA